MEERNNAPLVSVIVVTYNSSRFILETLDSIKVQTYKNIELIVSDDCSKDNTVEICREWIEQNKERFVYSKIVTTGKNTGTAGNDNRGVRESEGEWIKIIAGDDILKIDAIEKFVHYVQSDKQIECCFAKCIRFEDDIKDEKFTKEEILPQKMFFGDKCSPHKQFVILSRIYVGAGPSFFFSRKLYNNIEGFDERYPFQDDYVFFINITKKGYKLFLLDEYLVYYRMNPDSVCHTGSMGTIISPHEIRCMRDYKYQYKVENLNLLWRLFMKYSLFIRNKIIDNGNTFQSTKCRLYHKIYMLTDPFVNYSRLLRIPDYL